MHAGRPVTQKIHTQSLMEQRWLKELLEQQDGYELPEELSSGLRDKSPLGQVRLACELLRKQNEPSILDCFGLHQSVLRAHTVFPLFIRTEAGISLDEETFRRHTSNFKRLYVVTVYGLQFSGKSTLCNILLSTNSFTVGHNSRETTMGITAAVVPHSTDSDTALLLLDAEGTGVDQNRTVEVFLLVASVNSTVIFNFKGSLNPIKEVTARSFEYLTQVFKDPKTANFIFNKFIILQRDVGETFLDLGSCWREWMPERKPHSFVMSPLPLPSTEKEFPDLWQECSAKFRKSIFNLLRSILHLNPNLDACLSPDDLISNWKNVCEQLPYINRLSSLTLPEVEKGNVIRLLYELETKLKMPMRGSQFSRVVNLHSEGIRPFVKDDLRYLVSTKISGFRERNVLLYIEQRLKELHNDIDEWSVKQEEGDKLDKIQSTIVNFYELCLEHLSGTYDNNLELMSEIVKGAGNRIKNALTRLPTKLRPHMVPLPSQLPSQLPPTPSAPPVFQGEVPIRSIPKFSFKPPPTAQDVARLRYDKGGGGTDWKGSRHTRTWRVYDSDGNLIGAGYDKKHHNLAKARADKQALDNLTRRYEQDKMEAQQKYNEEVEKIREMSEKDQLSYDEALKNHRAATAEYEQRKEKAEKTFKLKKGAYLLSVATAMASAPHLLYVWHNSDYFDNVGQQALYVFRETASSIWGSVPLIFVGLAGMVAGGPLGSVAFQMAYSVASEGFDLKKAGQTAASAVHPFFSCIFYAASMQSQYAKILSDRQAVTAMEHLYTVGSAKTPIEWHTDLQKMTAAVEVGKSYDIPQRTILTGDKKEKRYFHRINDTLVTWSKQEIPKSRILPNPVSTPSFKEGMKAVSFSSSDAHDLMIRAMLTHLLPVPPHLLKSVLGVVNAQEQTDTLLFLEEAALTPFLKQALVDKTHGGIIQLDSTVDFLQNQILQVVLGLAVLQDCNRFCMNGLFATNLAITTVELEEGSRLTYHLKNGTEYELPYRGAVVKIDSCPFANMQFGTTKICWDSTASIVGDCLSKLGLDLPALGKIKARETKEFSDTFDLHCFFRSLAKTHQYSLWRHPLVTAFFALEDSKHALANKGKLPEMNLTAYFGDSVLDMLPTSLSQSEMVAFYLDAALPSKVTQMNPAAFGAEASVNDWLFTKDPSLPRVSPFASAICPFKSPITKGHDGKEVLHLHLPPFNGEEWFTGLSSQLLPSTFSLPSYLPRNSLPVQESHFLAEGKSGDKLYRGLLGETPVVIKCFKNVSDEALAITSTRHPFVTMGDVGLELACSIMCSRLYTSGKSPHFPQVYGAFVDSSTITKTESQGKVWDFFYGPKTESTTKTTVYLVSEFISGGTMASDFHKVIAELQYKAHQEEKTVPTREEFIHNAAFQVSSLLYTFQKELQGSHNDLHLGNLMIKFCDDTLFNGQPLNSYSHFHYEINGEKFQLPNLGFIVKVIDFGLSSFSFPEDTRGRRFSLSEESALWNKAYEIATKLSLPIPEALHKRWATAKLARQGIQRASLDLQTVCNHFTTHPFYHRNTATIAAEEQEYLQHFATEEVPEFENMSVILFSTLLGGLATARVPKSLDGAKTTPEQFLLSRTFARYRVECVDRPSSLLFEVERFLRLVEQSSALFHRMEKELEAKTMENINFLLHDLPDEVPDEFPDFVKRQWQDLSESILRVQAEEQAKQQERLAKHPFIKFQKHENLPTLEFQNYWILCRAAEIVGKECLRNPTSMSDEELERNVEQLSSEHHLLFYPLLDKLKEDAKAIAGTLAKKGKVTCFVKDMFQDSYDGNWMVLNFIHEPRKVEVHHPENKMLNRVVQVCEEVFSKQSGSS